MKLLWFDFEIPNVLPEFKVLKDLLDFSLYSWAKISEFDYACIYDIWHFFLPFILFLAIYKLFSKIFKINEIFCVISAFLICSLIFLAFKFLVSFNLFFSGFYFTLVVSYLSGRELLRLFFKMPFVDKNSIARILKFAILSSFYFSFFALLINFYLKKESQNIQNGFLHLIFICLFLIWTISFIKVRREFRRIIKREIRNQSSFFKKSIKFWYSSFWLFLILSLMIWVSAEGMLLIKSIASIVIWTSLHWTHLMFKKWRIAKLRSYKGGKESWKMLNQFFSYWGNLLLEPISIIIVLNVWGFNLFQITNNFFGPNLVSNTLYLISTFVFFRVLLLFSDSLVELWLSNKYKNSENKKRFETLLKTLQRCFKIFIFVIASFWILKIVGFDPTPIFANFWIISAGLTFGMQTLLKDFVNGVILLFEDTLKIGDFIEVGNHVGTVEEITLRVLKIRNLRGSLVSIPFNLVDIVSNRSKNYLYATFKVPVDYGSNTDDVISLIKKAAGEVKKNPELKKDILGDIEIRGISEMSSYGMMFNARMKITPTNILNIETAFYRACRRLLIENGITIGNPSASMLSEIFKK